MKISVSRIGSSGLVGTQAVYADETFTDSKRLTLGGTRIEIQHAGHAHTPGDSFVWLPDHGIVFSGDIVYMDRMLRVGSHSAHRSWIEAFEAMAEKQPTIVVGGHGRPGDLARATADTYDYLVFLRQAVKALIDAGVEPLWQRLGADCFNEAAVACPDGHHVMMIEARTFSQSELGSLPAPLVGRCASDPSPLGQV